MLLNKVFKSFASNKPPFCSVVIAAAGLSQRCKGEDKIKYVINGKSVLNHSIEVFNNCSLIKEIIVVVQEHELEYIAMNCDRYDYTKVIAVIKGGKTRAESVYNGVFAVSEKAEYIIVHDGARPCIDENLILRTILAAVKYSAAVPAVPVIPTIKMVKDGVVIKTIDRDGLYEMQTPQAFKSELLKAALTNVMNKKINVTDESMAVELLGMVVHTVEGSRRNIKITEPDDFLIATRFLCE
ncbi:MAG: 2-C-methyl-D-erythritol 4-phosphate cytidylyltransferase [Oscillospiraceae bacterium]|jgi:2-C-methyl-D-erythritol 4-phosphate cytidylyltransferase|nr:2-C-methyl-D-erythritol 4-phosphate cytidylyltransferase [Oscillospiraceae bacterium]